VKTDLVFACSQRLMTKFTVDSTKLTHLLMVYHYSSFTFFMAFIVLTFHHRKITLFVVFLKVNMSLKKNK